MVAICNVGLATGGEVKPVEFESGADVGRVLHLARFTARLGDQLILNGKPVNQEHPVQDRDTLLVTPPVEGGVA